MSLRLQGRLKLSTYLQRRLGSTNTRVSSSSIRKCFKDYFVNDYDHTLVASSPLRPLCDPTVPFVNAGMNQFKTILQGKTESPWTRATNSQKCARVGGKHNDLDAVGSDGYHHTFFEMLGNWSFGDYFKKEACKMAWELLTGPFQLDPSRLYVSYFAGDSGLEIPADLECKEIWLQLGVKKSHILPFGIKENFWEMGIAGPCGPCTEIHVDHVLGRHSASDRVNGGFPDVTELWNIVFIQYNRDLNGSLSSLPTHHIDTGMGFERLVAVLNGCLSNYDTDLFQPLLNAIQKETKLPAYSGAFDPTDDSFKRDQAYRIISDHSRLLTVALADGLFPHHQYKLRWILRKALKILYDGMDSDEKVLIELSNLVAESLHDVYPEIGKNLPVVQAIISSEADLYKSLLSDLPRKWISLVKETPRLETLLLMGSNPSALASAYEKLLSVKESNIPSSLSYQLYDSHGLSAEMIGALAEVAGLEFSHTKHQEEIEKQKWKSKMASAEGPYINSVVKELITANIPVTHDSFKYDYEKSSEKYIFPTVNARIIALVANGSLTEKVNGNINCSVVLDRTSFYHTAGGQINDTGLISVLPSAEESPGVLTVKNVIENNGFVFHSGQLKGSLEVGDVVSLNVNEEDRMGLMRNHTATHLLNGEIRRLLKATCQEGSVVESSFLKLTFASLGKEIELEDIDHIESSIKKIIQQQVPVKRYAVNSWNIPSETVLVPNEVYPFENIQLVDIEINSKLFSREACCGTHLINTGDIGAFCITEVIKKTKGKCSICAVTGPLAVESLANSNDIRDQVNCLKRDVQHFFGSDDLNISVKKINESLKEKSSTKIAIQKLLSFFKRHANISRLERKTSRRLSYCTFMEAEVTLKQVFKDLDRTARRLSELEVQDAAQSKRFLVHNVLSTHYLDSVMLNKITRNTSIPLLLISSNINGEVKARCCVPSEAVTDDFNATLWLQQIKKCFHPISVKYSSNTQGNHHSLEVANMPPVKINAHVAGNIIQEAMMLATDFATKYLSTFEERSKPSSRA